MMSKILLLTGFSPDIQYGGGAIVRSLVGRLDAEKIGWFCLSLPKQIPPAHFKQLIAGYYVFHPVGGQRLRLGRLWDIYYHRVWSKLAATRVAEVLEKLRADTLWVVLDYHIVPLAAELIKRSAAQRFHFSIHDHPIDMARWHLKSPSLIAAIEDGFDVIKNSNCSVDSVSTELIMATGLVDHPHALVTLGCQPKNCIEGIRPAEKAGPLRIGYAGSYLSGEQANILVQGLRQWSAASGREWEFHFFGAKASGPMPQEVKWRGFIPPDILSLELAKMSFLLLALSSDAPVSFTSLPTKLVSYLEVGRLILAMVPEGSASEAIIRQASLGPIVTIPRSSEVSKAINDGLNWDINVANQKRRELLRDRFCPDSIFRRFSSLILPK